MYTLGDWVQVIKAGESDATRKAASVMQCHTHSLLMVQMDYYAKSGLVWSRAIRANSVSGFGKLLDMQASKMIEAHAEHASYSIALSIA